MSDLKSNFIEIPKTEKEIEKSLDSLKLTETQRKIFDEQCEIAAKVLDLPSLTIRGFFSFAFIENQKYQKTTIAEQEARDDIRSLTQEELEKARIVNMKKILNGLKIKLERVVRVKKKDHLLDKAINDSLQHYINNYVKRPPDVKGK